MKEKLLEQHKELCTPCIQNNLLTFCHICFHSILDICLCVCKFVSMCIHTAVFKTLFSEPLERNLQTQFLVFTPKYFKANLLRTKTLSSVTTVQFSERRNFTLIRG